MIADRYQRPNWWVRHLVNPSVGGLTRAGVSFLGSRILEVRGRTSGLVRETPVYLLRFQGERYLVAPRGTTQWVRNLRAAQEGVLRLGRRREPFRFDELADADKPVILRAWIRRWRLEAAPFFPGIGGRPSDEVLLGIAPGYPVFRLRPHTS